MTATAKRASAQSSPSLSRRAVLQASVTLGAATLAQPALGQPKPASSSGRLRFGAHSFLWTGAFGHGSESAVAEAAAIGFDGIEIALSSPDQVTADEVRQWSERHRKIGRAHV